MFEIYKQLYKILVAFWSKRRLITNSIIVITGVALIIGYLSHNKYVVSNTLLIQDPALINPYIKDMTVYVELQNRMNDLNAQLQSQPILDKIAKHLDLITPEMSLSEKQTIYDTLADRISFIKPTKGPKDLIQDNKQENNLIVLQYLSNSRENAVQELNIITRVLLDNIFNLNSQITKDSEQFLKAQLLNKKRDLTIAQKKLADFISDNASSLPTLGTLNYEKLNKLQDTQSTLENNLASAKSDLLLQEHNLIQLNPELTELDERITQLQYNLALLREKSPTNKSQISEKMNELNELVLKREEALQTALKINITSLENIQGQVADAGASATGQMQQPKSLLLSQLKLYQTASLKVKNLELSMENLNDDITSVEKTINGSGQRDKTLSELKLDVDVKLDLYQKLLDRYQKTQDMQNLSHYLSNERVKVIKSDFQIPEVKGHSLGVYFLCGLIGGLFFGCGLAFLIEILDTTVRYREQIETNLKLPVLARVPNLSRC